MFHFGVIRDNHQLSFCRHGVEDLIVTPFAQVRWQLVDVVLQQSQRYGVALVRVKVSTSQMEACVFDPRPRSELPLRSPGNSVIPNPAGSKFQA